MRLNPAIKLLTYKRHMSTKAILILGMSIVCLPTAAFAAARVGRVVELRCDGLRAPLAVDAQQPRFRWEYDSRIQMPRGTQQAAARIIVGTSEAKVRAGEGEIWNSGWIQTAVMATKYEGPPLAPATMYWWSVRVRNTNRTPMGWSAPARFVTAPTTWTGKWIEAPWSTPRDGSESDGSRPMPVFRREFRVRERPVQALLRIAGLGQYWAALDGVHPIAPMGLHQAWTDYRKTVTYDTYDLTSSFSTAGKHVLGVLLGNGMYNVQAAGGGRRYTKFEGSFGPPKLIAELSLRYADGTTQIVGTDQAWRVARGPVLFSSTYGGEDYDARKLARDWDTAGFRDTTWTAPTVIDGPGGRLIPAIAPDVRNFVTYSPVSVKKPSSGKIIYDLGQNVAGWPEITVSGSAGEVLRLTPGELLNPDGTVSQTSSGGPQWWSYTLRGRTPETWTPAFSYYGFRYLQVQWEGGAASSGKVIRVRGRALRSDSDVAGSFQSSNGMLNRIHALILAAMHNNEMSLFTDCPHREKLGWLEQTHLVAPGLMFNSNLQALYRATAQNIADAQKPDGMVPTIAPQYTMFGPKYAIYDDSPEWGSASILAAWDAYRFYGDADDLQRNYPTMRRYLAYLENHAKDGIVAYGLGDWYDIGPGEPGFEKNTKLGVTGTLMLYEDAATMQRIASLLGYADDATRYGELAEREKTAFNARFWNPDAGYYDTGSQTSNAMPLQMGIVPEERQAEVLQHIVADIRAHDDHVTTGEVGFPYLVRDLTESGHSNEMLALMLRTDSPSYGSQLAAGATSLTEAWDANPKNSQDHFMLGGAEEWVYRGLGGIDLDMSRAPSARITIRPQIADGVRWVRCGYTSTEGRIESDWARQQGRTRMDVTIPAGAEATVVVPAHANDVIMESGKPAASASYLRLIRRDTNAAIYQVQSGTYHFAVTGSRNKSPIDYQGFERATAMPRTSLGYWPLTAQ
jgi:alpha-L-rhamnosidase